jgi:hypothetical protein
MQQKYLVLRDFLLISINLPDGLSREPGARSCVLKVSPPDPGPLLAQKGICLGSLRACTSVRAEGRVVFLVKVFCSETYYLRLPLERQIRRSQFDKSSAPLCASLC